jgi:hypothetical protein
MDQSQRPFVVMFDGTAIFTHPGAATRTLGALNRPVARPVPPDRLIVCRDCGAPILDAVMMGCLGEWRHIGCFMLGSDIVWPEE